MGGREKYGAEDKRREENKEEKKRYQCMRWVPQKREAGERIGQNDKREEGKLRRGRRQCFVLGGDPGGRQGKEWGNTKGRREN